MLNNYIITLYWLKKQSGGDKIKKWDTLEHNGVIFYPEYEPINIPILYEKKYLFEIIISYNYITWYQ